MLGVTLIVLAIFLLQTPWKQSPKNTIKPPDFKIVFIGDSMTEYLGNFDELQADLQSYYPGKTFLLLNYGYGSTNLLTVPDRLEKETSHSGRMFQPINDIDFNLVLIESFGHNPLSQYSLDEGLAKQNQLLDQIIGSITRKHPHSSIVFVATIAPNKENYGLGTVDLTPEKRIEWANERISYIQNHINYANSRNIPLINIYQKSLDQTGDGKLEYISNTDHIHPSPDGVYFISQEIADFIFSNHLL